MITKAMNTYLLLINVQHCFNYRCNTRSISSLWDEFANWRGLGGYEHPALEYYGNTGPVVQVSESGEDSSRRATRRVPVE
ncbi:hypothetical protein KY290_002175 [Solanum tuberosum]|uniref:Uncharacterized protein n=1 Tax=Solanum tuberosum TaxID=4113 RepID=A0ABQ7WPB3_SOLTU|nr:hypothetical protein KY284_002217 [Solanum tuberosum]KAH0731143.1 hypothetical protein KY289_002331 [Solanum tuberosum]KAH0766193.1 hypothetical protein KY285_002064 [Solanum tuberosum]KAH0782577.1 hypothetical protein KY290_002175 [Solanum tuberosum]